MQPKQIEIVWKPKKVYCLMFIFVRPYFLHSPHNGFIHTKCMGTYANHSLPNKIATYVFRKTKNCFSPFYFHCFHFWSQCWCSFMLLLSYSQYQSGHKFEWICRMVCNWNRSIHSFNNIKITIVTYVFCENDRSLFFHIMKRGFQGKRQREAKNRPYFCWKNK